MEKLSLRPLGLQSLQASFAVNLKPMRTMRSNAALGISLPGEVVVSLNRGAPPVVDFQWGFEFISENIGWAKFTTPQLWFPLDLGYLGPAETYMFFIPQPTSD